MKLEIDQNFTVWVWCKDTKILIPEVNRINKLSTDYSKDNVFPLRVMAANVNYKASVKQ